MTSRCADSHFLSGTFTTLSRSWSSMLRRMKIMIVTDAWFPQTNGVVNTLAQTAAWLVRFGHEVRVISRRDFPPLPCPAYPEVGVAVRPIPTLAREFGFFRPQAVHIATEGPLGL